MLKALRPFTFVYIQYLYYYKTIESYKLPQTKQEYNTTKGNWKEKIITRYTTKYIYNGT